MKTKHISSFSTYILFTALSTSTTLYLVHVNPASATYAFSLFALSKTLADLILFGSILKISLSIDASDFYTKLFSLLIAASSIALTTLLPLTVYQVISLQIPLVTLSVFFSAGLYTIAIRRSSPHLSFIPVPLNTIAANVLTFYGKTALLAIYTALLALILFALIPSNSRHFKLYRYGSFSCLVNQFNVSSIPQLLILLLSTFAPQFVNALKLYAQLSSLSMLGSTVTLRNIFHRTVKYLKQIPSKSYFNIFARYKLHFAFSTIYFLIYLVFLNLVSPYIYSYFPQLNVSISMLTLALAVTFISELLASLLPLFSLHHGFSLQLNLFSLFFALSALICFYTGISLGLSPSYSLFLYPLPRMGFFLYYIIFKLATPLWLHSSRSKHLSL